MRLINCQSNTYTKPVKIKLITTEREQVARWVQNCLTAQSLDEPINPEPSYNIAINPVHSRDKKRNKE